MPQMPSLGVCRAILEYARAHVGGRLNSAAGRLGLWRGGAGHHVRQRSAIPVEGCHRVGRRSNLEVPEAPSALLRPSCDLHGSGKRSWTATASLFRRLSRLVRKAVSRWSPPHLPRPPTVEFSLDEDGQLPISRAM